LTDERNSTEANLQIKRSNLQVRNRTGSYEEVQNKVMKSNPNPVKICKIQSKSITKLKIRRI